jgi:hypothetical protein
VVHIATDRSSIAIQWVLIGSGGVK